MSEEKPEQIEKFDLQIELEINFVTANFLEPETIFGLKKKESINFHVAFWHLHD